MKIKFKKIGYIKTPYSKLKGIPIQSSFSDDSSDIPKGKIILKKKYVEGLSDMEGFSYMYLLFYLHKSIDYKLSVVPFLDNKKRGVFATRAPKRPNPIGLSIVKILSIKDNIIEFENPDMLNGTPLLDIKPYISKFDNRVSEKNGWTDTSLNSDSNPKSDNRFEK